jgi:hypothetical protein
MARQRQRTAASPKKVITLQRSASSGGFRVEVTPAEYRLLVETSGGPMPPWLYEVSDAFRKRWQESKDATAPGSVVFEVRCSEAAERLPRPVWERLGADDAVGGAFRRVLVGESVEEVIPLPREFGWSIVCRRENIANIVAKQQAETTSTRDAGGGESLTELEPPKLAKAILAEIKELVQRYDGENEARRSKVQSISDELVRAKFGELDATERDDLTRSFVALLHVSGSVANFVDVADTECPEKPVLSIDCVASGGSKGVVLMRGRNAAPLHKLARWASIKIRSVLQRIYK